MVLWLPKIIILLRFTAAVICCDHLLLSLAAVACCGSLLRLRCHGYLCNGLCTLLMSAWYSLSDVQDATSKYLMSLSFLMFQKIFGVELEQIYVLLRHFWYYCIWICCKLVLSGSTFSLFFTRFWYCFQDSLDCNIL